MSIPTNESTTRKNYKEGIQELEQDWYPNKPNMQVDARVRRIANGTDTRQLKKLEEMNLMTEKDIPQPNYTTIHAYKKDEWQVVGFRCIDCGKVMGKMSIVEKHPLICNFSLKINKEEEQELLQKVRKK